MIIIQLIEKEFRDLISRGIRIDNLQLDRLVCNVVL